MDIRRRCVQCSSEQSSRACSLFTPHLSTSSTFPLSNIACVVGRVSHRNTWPLDRAADTASSTPGTATGALAGGGQIARVEDDGDHNDVAVEVPNVEKLNTAAVQHTRGHVSRLRDMVNHMTRENL